MTDISLQKTAETAKRARARPFPKGQSGNPAGWPRGSSNRATRAVEILLGGEATPLTRKAVELALGGSEGALRLCLDRIIAPRRERPIQLAARRGAGRIRTPGAAGSLFNQKRVKETSPRS
jgi:hypothetical protein